MSFNFIHSRRKVFVIASRSQVVVYGRCKKYVLYAFMTMIAFVSIFDAKKEAPLMGNEAGCNSVQDGRG